MRRLRAAVLVVLTAALAGIPVALAVGATPSSPVVTSAAATNVTDTGAVLHGTVNPERSQTSYAFQWGPTAGYGHETTLTPAGAGSSAAAIQAAIANLTPGTTYHFRTIAINVYGAESFGADQTLTTTGTKPAPSTPPTATTQSATGVQQSGATLHGTVNPKGQATTYYFEYGKTNGYGFQTAPKTAPAGNSDISAAAAISGLSSSTTYHFRLVAVSPGGTTLGSDQTLKTTTPPAVSTGGVSKVRDSSAVLGATVNPEGQPTSYHFQFGTTTGYGLNSRSVYVGSGTGNVAVHRSLQGLVGNTVYHYRVVSQSPGGISYGADRTFKTAGPKQAPSHVRVLGRMGFVSRGGYIGAVFGCFGGDTRCSGHYTLKYRNRVLAEQDFSMKPRDGGFRNVRLNSTGRRMFGRDYRRPLLVQLSGTTTSGQQLSQAMTLARWR